jgi:hypothetical protein
LAATLFDFNGVQAFGALDDVEFTAWPAFSVLYPSIWMAE